MKKKSKKNVVLNNRNLLVNTNITNYKNEKNNSTTNITIFV